MKNFEDVNVFDLEYTKRSPEASLLA